MLTPLVNEIVWNPNIFHPAAGHVITGNLKIMSDSRICSIIYKGLKYIDFNLASISKSVGRKLLLP